MIQFQKEYPDLFLIPQRPVAELPDTSVSEYELTRALPESLKSALPTIEEIEAELGTDIEKND